VSSNTSLSYASMHKLQTLSTTCHIYISQLVVVIIDKSSMTNAILSSNNDNNDYL